MTRYFKNIFLTANEFENIKSTKILFKENECDGLIIHLIGQINKNSVYEKTEKLNDDRIIIKVPKEDLKGETYDELKQFEAIQFLKNS